MTNRRWKWARVAAMLAIVVAGCGRIGFSVGVTGDGSVDGPQADNPGPDGPADGPGGACTASQCPNPAPCSAHSGHFFCEDFESGDLDLWDAVEGDVTVDAMAHGGNFSARAAASTASRRARLTTTWNPRFDDGTLYGRAYYYVPSGQTTEDISIFEFVDDTQDDFIGVFLVDTGIEGALQVENQAGAGEGVSSSPNAIPFDAWFCLTLTMTVAPGASGHSAASVNGSPFVEHGGDAVGTEPSSGYNALETGIPYLEQDAAFELYVDDILVDEVPVNCD